MNYSEKNPLVIKYDQRLGDVIRMLPLAKHYSDLGREVFIDCFMAYADILKCVSYVNHIREGIKLSSSPEIIDLQIWNDNDSSRYIEFRKSGLDWMDFVYKDFPQVDRTIVFDKFFPIDSYDLPEKYALCFPIGCSQIYQWDINYIINVSLQYEKLYQVPVYFVVNPENQSHFKKAGLKTLWASKLEHLPNLIRNAEGLTTINTSASIIAGAVMNKNYYHFCEPSYNFQDDHKHERQIRIEPAGAKVES